jgi:hypothetical protein
MIEEQCDGCNKTYDRNERHVVARPRPSDPRELVAVMWFCPECGEQQGLPSAEQVTLDVENGKYPGVIFATV